MVRAYSFHYLSFVCINHKHCILYTGDEDLRGRFRGEAHAPEVSHIFNTMDRYQALLSDSTLTVAGALT